jgi:hypothetical protein
MHPVSRPERAALTCGAQLSHLNTLVVADLSPGSDALSNLGPIRRDDVLPGCSTCLNPWHRTEARFCALAPLTHKAHLSEAKSHDPKYQL